MADVLLTLNGIGHGHLVRALQVSRWLRRAHRRPVIFFQGHYPQELSLRVPGVGIWALYELPSATAQLVATQVASYAALNGPAVVIEDTHPAPVSWLGDQGPSRSCPCCRPGTAPKSRASSSATAPAPRPGRIARPRRR